MTQQEWIEQQRKLLDPQKQANLAASAGIYDAQRQNTQALYQGQIADTTASYEDALRSNETQKFLNQRAMERRMAEMGLTDSGLNRTQQTAVMLSAANNRGAIERQRQKAVDTLAATMASELATIDAKKAAAAQEITNTFENNAYTQGTSLYNNEQANIAAENAARIKAEGTTKTLWDSTGVTDEYDNLIFVDKDGNKKTVAKGYSPYGFNSNTQYAAEKKAGIKFSSNGYQPLGLVSEGGNFEAVTVNGRPIDYYGTGKRQNIWVSPNGNYFYWDGSINQYVTLTAQDVAALEQKHGVFDKPFNIKKTVSNDGAKRRKSNKNQAKKSTATKNYNDVGKNWKFN